MGHLINPISFRVGFFGYWLDNWSPWQYYAYAEMLHQNLVLRDLLKEFLDGEFLRKASFFYSHFTIQYFEQKRFVIKIYYYDGLTEQVVQCVSSYWAKWAMKRNKLYKKKIRRFKYVKKTFVKDNLLFWWRYVDYNFASKIIWFLFLMMTLSFERKNRRSRGRRHYNYRFHKYRLKFLKRKRFLFTIDQYIKLVRRLRFNKRRFNFFKKIFFFYYRANFKRLWYTFLLRDAHFEVFSFLRVFFMLFFKYIRFAYYKRRFFNRTLLYKRIKQRAKNESESIITLFNHNKFAKKIINPAHMGVHPNFFLQNPFIPRRFKLKNRKLSIILKNFRWMWHYYFIHKHKGLKHYRLRLKHIYGDRVPYYIYNLPGRFFYSKRWLNKKIRFLKLQNSIKKSSYTNFYKRFFSIKQKRRRRFFLDERKISNVGRYYPKYLQYLRFIVLGGSKRISANYYDNRWLFRNAKYKSPQNGYFVQLRYKRRSYRFLTNNSVLLKKVRKVYRKGYYVYKRRFFSKHPGFIRRLVELRNKSISDWNSTRIREFKMRFKNELLNLKNIKFPEVFTKFRLMRGLRANRSFNKKSSRYFFNLTTLLKQRDFRYKKMAAYMRKSSIIPANTTRFTRINLKKFLNFSYYNNLRNNFLNDNFSLKQGSFLQAYSLFKRLLRNRELKYNLLKQGHKFRDLRIAKSNSRYWQKTFNSNKSLIFKNTKSLKMENTFNTSNFVTSPLKQYFAHFRWKIKYSCFKNLYKYVNMHNIVSKHGLIAYIQYLKSKGVENDLTKINKKLDSNLIDGPSTLNAKNKSAFLASYYIYKAFLEKDKHFNFLFVNHVLERRFLSTKELILFRQLLRKFNLNYFISKIKVRYKDAFTSRNKLLLYPLKNNASDNKFFSKSIKFNKAILNDFAEKSTKHTISRRGDIKKSLFSKHKNSLFNWRETLVYLAQTNSSWIKLISYYLSLSKKKILFTGKSFFWIILLLYSFMLILKKRSANPNSYKITMFSKQFLSYTKYRINHVIKQKRRPIWLNKYNKDFFSRKQKSFVSAYDYLLLRKLRLGFMHNQKNLGMFNTNNSAMYLKQQMNLYPIAHSNVFLSSLLESKSKLSTEKTFIANPNLIAMRMLFLLKLLFWKENTQYAHLKGISDFIFEKTNFNLTFFRKDSSAKILMKKNLQVKFFSKIKRIFMFLKHSNLKKNNYALNDLGNTLRFKYMVRKFKNTVLKLKKISSVNQLLRSIKYSTKYKWYHTGRISHQKILRRRLYRHLVKISEYAHSDQYVFKLNLPSNKWKNFSLYKKFYKTMKISAVKRPNFYSKRLVFLRSYWLYGLFSYYFVQRRAQFLYVLNREKNVVSLIEPLYVYFSHYRVTDIICRRLVMGFVRSLLVMERFRIQFIYFEQKFIDLCKDYVLFPFIVRFYGIDNDIVTAVFIARYISAKLEYKFSVWELFKPIGKDLKVVSRGTKMLLGYKLQFIGRLKRRDRLRYVYNMGGSLPLSKRDAFIEHGYFTGILKNGKCSVRVWIYRHKSFADFFFNYLYVLY